ncbi:MAG: SUMF1/EgtB/PvdO family nonheme iron enzyme, partial [Acidimicrobiia bacterium]
MRSSTTSLGPAVDREAAIEWFLKNRRRSRELFELVSPAAYFMRPIALRNPIVFYEGHLPAFNVNVLLKKALRHPGIDPQLETLFARGIDPEDEVAAAPKGRQLWPSRRDVQRYAEAADQGVLESLKTDELDQPENPYLIRGLAVYTILEHEAMHQETLAYMWHRLPYDLKTRAEVSHRLHGAPPEPATVRIPSGTATLGADRGDLRFGWDNEFPAQRVDVSRFEIDVCKVTNQDYLEFVNSGGYQTEALWTPEDWAWRVSAKLTHPLFWERDDDQWFWRGMFARLPLPMSWPVYVSHAEASAYARWKNKRLPTEAEFHRAAYGTESGVERPYPWGDQPPDATRGNFDFASWDPTPVGSYPAGRSAWGLHDLV